MLDQIWSGHRAFIVNLESKMSMWTKYPLQIIYKQYVFHVVTVSQGQNNLRKF